MDKKKQTQVGKVWEHLQKNGSITRDKAVELGVYDLCKAIYKLKKNLSNGYAI